MEGFFVQGWDLILPACGATSTLYTYIDPFGMPEGKMSKTLKAIASETRTAGAGRFQQGVGGMPQL